VNRIEDLPAQLRAEIGHFFSVYKDLDPDKHSQVDGWDGLEAALATIEESRERFRAQRS
jgi:inorganic pyrophosphatase